MAEDNERAPLLAGSGVGSSSNTPTGSPRNSLPPTFATQDSIDTLAMIQGGSGEGLAAVFVASFDTVKGNCVEFVEPEIDCDGIEFKAIASGFHLVENDTVYFKMRGLFGVACFRNKLLASAEERGARMKSVGVLCRSYDSLHRHVDFLQQEAIRQTDDPGDYENLMAYFEKQGEGRSRSGSASAPSVADNLQVTHPYIAGSFSQFVKFYGANVFLLWKALLLRKRVLFYAPPPIGVPCFRVYNACTLPKHSLPPASVYVNESNPLFYVNVADIDEIEELDHYVACTTESIFLEKEQLYDVYVNNQEIIIKEEDKGVLQLTQADMGRFQYICRFSNLVHSDKGLRDYFLKTNSTLLDNIMNLASNHDEVVPASALPSELGLDPKDVPFLRELVVVYGIPGLELADPTSMCCC